MDVARQRGLGNIEAAAHKLAAQFVLTGDARGRHQVSNYVMAIKFSQVQFAKIYSRSMYKDTISCINIHSVYVK